jgi:hypothetical protein
MLSEKMAGSFVCAVAAGRNEMSATPIASVASLINDCGISFLLVKFAFSNQRIDDLNLSLNKRIDDSNQHNQDSFTLITAMLAAIIGLNTVMVGVAFGVARQGRPVT